MAMVGRRYVASILLLVALSSLRWFTTYEFISPSEKRHLQLDDDVTGRHRVNTSSVTSVDEPFDVYHGDIYEGLDERIDKMEADTLPFLPNYRSPCWYEHLSDADPYPLRDHLFLRFFIGTAKVRKSFWTTFENSIAVFKERLRKDSNHWRLRCLPSFYLIGINRGGSTALWRSLLAHPYLMGSSTGKELHYWNEIRYGAGLVKVGYGSYNRHLKNDTIPRPLKSYVDVFDWAAEKIRNIYLTDKEGRIYHPVGLGEGTPTYLTDFGNWKLLDANKGYQEPKFTLANILKMLTPSVRIVVILRDPINRLVSEYATYERHHEKTPEQFHRLTTDAIRLMTSCLRNRTLRGCAYDATLTSTTEPVILQHSLYYPFIKDWMDVFTTKQMIVLRSEDFYKYPKKVTNKVFRFFGLAAMDKVLKAGRNERMPSSFVPFNRTLDMLRDFFYPYNEKLAAYLGSNKFLWKTP